MKKIGNLAIISFFTIMLFTACSNEQRPILPYQAATNDLTDGTDTDNSSEITRPTGAVFLQSNVCGCKAGQVITLGNCTATCSAHSSDTNETLYLNVEVGPEIELTDLVDVYGWCNTEITDPDTGEVVDGGANPSCVLQLKDESGNISQASAITSSGSKTVRIDIASFASDKTYRIKLIEVVSGAESDTIQFRKISELPDNDTLGPLWPMPVTQYTCMNVTTSTDQNNGDVYYESASRILFYFVPEVRPDPIDESVVNFYCHDIFKYGSADPGLEKLEETPGAFTLWSRWDPRMYDLDGNGVMDVHDKILEEVNNSGATLSAAPEIFFPFQWMSEPTLSTSTTSTAQSSATMQTLGYYMTPWVDASTLKSYCPTQVHYYSSNELFKAMRDIIGVDTEGLYIAKKVGDDCTFMLIRESLLTQIWFYMENNLPIQPNSNTVRGKKVQYYWPADTSTPFIKKSHQSTYTVYSSSELSKLTSCSASSADTSASSVNSNYPTHDKRIGCVPVGQ